MGLTYDEFMKNLKEGKVEPVSNSSAPYENAVVTVVRADLMPAKLLPSDAWIKKFIKDGEATTFHFQLEVNTESGKSKIVDEYTQLLNSSDEIACYPSYTNKAGKKKAGTLLYDIVHGAKEYDEKQIPEDWVKKIDKVLKGVKFNCRAKFVKDGAYAILETSYQKLKDEEYLAEAAAKNKSQDSTAPSDGKVITDPNDLPF